MAAALGDQNPRFKSENILTLELDLPDRTTYDLADVMEAQSALDAVLGGAEDGSGSEAIVPLEDIGNVGGFKDDMSPVLNSAASKAAKMKRLKSRRMSSIM